MSFILCTLLWRINDDDDDDDSTMMLANTNEFPGSKHNRRSPKQMPSPSNRRFVASRPDGSHKNFTQNYSQLSEQSCPHDEQTVNWRSKARQLYKQLYRRKYMQALHVFMVGFRHMHEARSLTEIVDATYIEIRKK